MMHPSQMSAGDTGLVVIDVQEKLMPIVPGAKTLIRNIAFLLDVAKALSIPVQATEQYPKGLGPLVPELAQRLPKRIEKLDFSCCAVREVVDFFQGHARPKVLLTGIMTHVCVMHSALDFLAEGFRVYIAADAVAASDEIDHEYGLHRMERAGAILTTSEAAAFEWVGKAGTPEFKAVNKLVQERAASLKK